MRLTYWLSPTPRAIAAEPSSRLASASRRSDIHLPMTTANALPAGVWTHITWSGTAARSGERIIPQIYATNQTTATGSVIYDDCSFTAG
jgi:hypothetical protein